MNSFSSSHKGFRSIDWEDLANSDFQAQCFPQFLSKHLDFYLHLFKTNSNSLSNKL